MFSQRMRYAVWGVGARLTRRSRCPACGERGFETIDRKPPFRLQRCDQCRLAYRFPYESEQEMRRFYQRAYQQKGLTTDLPTADELDALIRTGFANTEKDMSRVVAMLAALGVPRGARILDFGANWGYGAWQFREAGYESDAFELSIDRAAYGKRLGVDIATDLDALADSAHDVVYSSHVLEHVPNPTETLRRQLALLKPGGILLAHTPNGSDDRRHAEIEAFHRHWGRVHPVLLCEQFVERFAGERPCLVFSQPNLSPFTPEQLEQATRWARTGAWDRGPMRQSELCFAIRKPHAP